MSKRIKKRHLEVKEQTVASQPKAGNVDREAGVIRNVQVCGPLSRNGRNYAQALEAAVPLYEGRKVNIDHGLAPGEERSLLVGFGVIRNARLEGDAIYGDLHFLKSHSLAERICEQAERFPETFGLSHDADIDGYVDDAGVFQVTEITAVRSVDLVGDPATARGIFESRERHMKKTFRQVLESAPKAKVPGLKSVLEAMDDMMLDDMPVSEMDVDMPEETSSEDAIASAFEQALIAIAQDSSLDTAAKKKKLGELLTMQDKLAGKEETPATEAEETDTEKPDEKAMESWKKRTVAEARKAVREEMQAYHKEQLVDSVLESAGLESDSPLRGELLKLKTRAEMEEHVGGGSFVGSFGGYGMPVRESAGDNSLANQPRDPHSIAQRLGFGSN